MNLPFCRVSFGHSWSRPTSAILKPTQVSPGDRARQAQIPGVAHGCYHRAVMRFFGQAALLAWCLGVAACGSSEPRSPLILGDKPPRSLPGPRDLTSEQSRSLQSLITQAGQACGGITLAYLSGIDLVKGSETWEVRCPDMSYAVLIQSDGTPAAIHRCRDERFERPCASPARRPAYQRSEPEGSELNPDLKKLLEPLTAKDGKTD